MRHLISTVIWPNIMEPEKYDHLLSDGLVRLTEPDPSLNSFEYALQVTNFDEGKIGQYLRAYKEVPLPNEGDLVVYRTKFFCTSHLGRYCGNGRVRSKWGTGPVFEHYVTHLPIQLGYFSKYVRKTNAS